VKIPTHSINSGIDDTSGSIGSKFGLSDDLHPTSHTKKAISRVVKLGLKQS
jgi:hypothetical protein